MNIKLLFISPNAEFTCETSARVCYDSHDKQTDESYTKMLPTLLKAGHLSVFEHSSASFLIEGISRAASHQLVRHRMSSFSQRSQRYVNEAEFPYVVPPSIADNPEALDLYQTLMQRINEDYANLVALGVKKEDARFVLPNAAQTTLVMTANFRQWLHVIDMRVSKSAQWEIRELMTLIWKELYAHAPHVFGLQYFESWSKDAPFKRTVFEERIQ